MVSTRIDDLRRLYGLLAHLEKRTGGKRILSECSGSMKWPQRGVYFFFEDGEIRSDTGSDLRVVRVGTHALTAGSRTRIWQRLSQHRGVVHSGGGNHRGSIFRLLVGTALLATDSEQSIPTWGRGSTASREIRLMEINHEMHVSTVIGRMPFLWLEVNDEPGSQSLRGIIERNSIALLSNYDKAPLDPPSSNWLGQFCNRERVRDSGLWNQNHVDEEYNPAFLNALERLIAQMETFS